MKNFKIVSIFICILSCFTLQARAQNYCNLKSCSPGTHTLCKYPSSQPAAACVKYRSVGLTSAQQNAIVVKHNEYRRRVANGQESRGNPGPQPRATNMKNLSWDARLATIAQRWANQCNFGHDTCRNVAEYSVGQNVGSIGTTGPYDKNVEKIVTNWYNEVKDFDRNEVPKFTGRNFQAVGHYTQLVWGNTEKVGCGLIEYLSGRFNTTYLVCNYGPTGNFIGQPVYKTR